MRHVEATNFSGPLELLLSLIEQEELDISQIALAKVTEQYITELQKMSELPIDELAEFLVVAAKLLLIKSRLMVPGQAAENDEGGLDLERQLRMYKAFVDASHHIAKRFNKHRPMFAREGYAAMEPIFNPPEDLQAPTMYDIFHSVLKDIEPITRLPQTVIVRTINIREKINQIKEHLLQHKHASFHDLLRSAATRTDAIVTFLSVLEMVKQRSVTVVQSTMYADMQIETLDETVTEPLTITSI